MDLTIRHYKWCSLKGSMWKYLRALIGISSVLADCSLSHKEVWQCIVGDNCLDSVHLHQRTKPLTNSYQANDPTCWPSKGTIAIDSLRTVTPTMTDASTWPTSWPPPDMADVMASSACQRSCIWRQTMHDLAC